MVLFLTLTNLCICDVKQKLTVFCFSRSRRGLADEFVWETQARARSTIGAGQKNDKSSSKTITSKTPKEAKQTRYVSKKQVSNHGKPSVCGDFILYRIWGSKAKIKNSTELTNKVDEGNLIVVSRDGTVAD